MSYNLKDNLHNLLSKKKFGIIDVIKNKVSFHEEDIMKIIVKGLPEDTVVIKLPTIQNNQNEGFFNDHYIKICDYIIVYETEESTTIVLCELKKTLTAKNKKKARKKLKHTKPLLYYILVGLEVHFNFNMNKPIRKHKVLLTPDNKMSKKSTRASSEKYEWMEGRDDIKMFIKREWVSFDKMIESRQDGREQ